MTYQALVEFTSNSIKKVFDTHRFYLITTRINPMTKRSSMTSDQIDYSFEQHQALYRHFSHHLVGNYSRPSKYDLLPKTFDFLDDAGSKGLPVHRLEVTPHVHSIYCVMNEHAKQVDRLIDTNFLTMKTRFHPELRKIESIHAVPITHHMDDVIKVVRYSSKLLKHPVANHETLYNFNPCRKM